MNRVNITIQVEESEKRRSRHGSIVFAESATSDDAAEALERNGFDRVSIPGGWRRSLFQIDQRSGGKAFEFFIVDEVIPPEPPPLEEQPPPQEEAGA